MLKMFNYCFHVVKMILVQMYLQKYNPIRSQGERSGKKKKDHWEIVKCETQERELAPEPC